MEETPLIGFSPDIFIPRPALEAAFLYFDRNAVGYFKESDLEMMFSSVGQGLSKRQFRSLLSLCPSYDQGKLNYDIFLNQNN